MTDSLPHMKLAQTRKLFEMSMYYMGLRNKKNRYEWLTREDIQKLKRYVEEGKSSDRYYVEKFNDEKVLKIASGVRGYDSQVVPIEDFFDVIYTAHIFTGHGNVDIMREYCKNNKLHLPLKALRYFLSTCTACNQAKLNIQLEGSTYAGFLELIDMSDYPDGENKFIMHYRALGLSRVFMQPLRSSDKVEVVKQLIELFAQVGIPRALHSPTKSYTKAVIIRLAILIPNCKILSGRKMEFEGKNMKIKARLQKWMIDNNSSQWSVGIYYLIGTGYVLRKRRNKKSEEPKVYEKPNKINLHFYKSELIEQKKKEDCADFTLPGTSSEINVQSVDRIPKNSAVIIEKPYSLVTEEVLQLLRPAQVYKKNTQQSMIPQPRLTIQRDKKIVKIYTKKKSVRTYTKKKSITSQMPFLLAATTDNEKTQENKSLCINTNLKGIYGNASKNEKKLHQVWNTVMDLPSQEISTLKRKTEIIMEKDRLNMEHFGKISIGFDEHLDSDGALHNVIKQIDSLSADNSSFEDNTISKEQIPPITYLECHNIKKEELFYDVDMETKGIMPLEIREVHDCKTSTRIKDESLFDYSLENNVKIKDEPVCFEDVTIFSELETIPYKEETPSFGAIVKVESLNE